MVEAPRSPVSMRARAHIHSCMHIYTRVRTCVHTHAREGPGSMNGVNCILRWNRPTNLFSLSFTTGHRRVASKYRRCLCIFADRLPLLQILPLSPLFADRSINYSRRSGNNAKYSRCDIYLENWKFEQMKLRFRWNESLRNFEYTEDPSEEFFFFSFLLTKFRASLKLRSITKL